MSDTTLVQRPFLNIVMKADPTFFRDRRTEVEYEFSRGTVFTGNRAERGAYGAYAPITADDFFQDATPDVFQDPAASSSGSSPGELDFSDPDQSGLLEVI